MNSKLKIQNVKWLRRKPSLLLVLFYILHFTFYIPIAHAAPIYPADPDAASRQWYLSRIEAYEAWGKTTGSQEVIVAVIDTGVDLDHVDLAANLWKNTDEILDGVDNDGNGYVDDLQGWDFVDGDNDPSPNLNGSGVRPQAVHHGTVIAGIIGAVGNNGIGGTGLNWQVKIMPLRALDSRGRGNVATVIQAVQYAVRKGVDVINLSFVGPGFDRDLFIVLQDALRRGVLTVGAVGNTENGSGTDLDVSPLYPVCYSGSEGEDVVIGVAAVDDQDQKSTFSNYGANCVDLSAPGVDIYGPQFHDPSRGYESYFGGGFAGSSMAAPLVSGTAALIKALNPSFAAQEIRNILVQTTDSIELANPGFNGKLGKGRLNVRRALELAASGGSAVFGPSRGIPYLLTAPFSGGLPKVQILLGAGNPMRDFPAYGLNFKGGMQLASGDIDGDKTVEIITGAGASGGPHVRVFHPDGSVVRSFFAYDPRFRGGVRVAVGDLNGDGKDEIVTSPGPGGGPHVRIFNETGAVVGSFFAYNSRLRGGANLAVKDVDGDGKEEIIVTPGKGKGYEGEVRIFNAQGKLKGRFSAYPRSFEGGVNVAAGDIDGNGKAEIITAPAGGVLPEVRVYNSDGRWQRAFLAYNEAFLGGVNLAVEDFDRDRVDDIITGPGKGGGAHVVVFDGFGRVKQQFFPYDDAFRGGVSVGIIKL